MDAEQDVPRDCNDSQAYLDALKAELLGVALVSTTPVSNREKYPARSFDQLTSGVASGERRARPYNSSPSFKIRAKNAARKPLAELASDSVQAKGLIHEIDDASHCQEHSYPRKSETDRHGKDDHLNTSSRQRGGNMDLGEEDSLPPTYPQQILPPLIAENEDQFVESNSFKEEDPSATKPNVSQQTPTQVNEERNYEDTLATFSGSIARSQSQKDDSEPHTLLEDETGAVNFGNLSQIARQSSPVSEDVGFENTRSGWREHEQTSQQFPTNAPETPALPKNPFAVKPGNAVPFGGTQLFGQTQLLTSAVKPSPASSRPSPNLFHNSVSPNLMETSPLKNRANVSSPTDIRTSSPQRLQEVPATVVKRNKLGMIQEESLNNSEFSGLAKEDTIPESPMLQLVKSPGDRRGPLAHYETMQKSQERKISSSSVQRSISPESDYDDAFRKMARQKLVERKRARAAQQMDKVHVSRPSSRGSTEKHATKRRRRLTEENSTDEGLTLDDTKLDQDRNNVHVPTSVLHTSQRVVQLSLESPSVESSTKATPGANDADIPEHQTLPDTETEVLAELVEEEMIPATSPLQPLPMSSNGEELPASEPELPLLPGMSLDDANLASESSSLPALRRRVRKTYGRSHGRARRNPFLITSTLSSGEQQPAPADQPTNSDALVYDTNTTEMEHEINITNQNHGGMRDRSLQPEPPQHVGTRSRGKQRAPLTSVVDEVSPSVSSSLTPLSQTPRTSSRTTPTTRGSERPAPSKETAVQTPTVSRGLRARASRQTRGSQSPFSLAQSVRSSSRLSRLDSGVAEYPPQSPTVSALAASRSRTKSVKSLCSNATGSKSDDGRLFESMVFAISLQHEQNEQQTRSKLESRIVDAGGTILQDGFHEMFASSAVTSTAGSTSDMNSSLESLKPISDSGFTALLADGHSRKTKYMQALALGLPCLAYQWVEACFTKARVVDWEPYLLCAGSSAVLGNAIRSRTLPRYIASQASFGNMVEHRPRLLDGSRLLVVMDPRKARSQTKQQYVFLAQALGPSITRVTTIAQAKDALHKSEQGGAPFDWLYIDPSIGSPEDVFSTAATGNKKRKRRAQPVASAGLRILRDELLIQSLVLGRMIEPEEEFF